MATQSPRRVYLDYAASAPLRESAREAWLEASEELNPGGQYASGRRANARLAESREIVADALGAEPIEVIFTGSGTEADNLAVAGFAAAAPDRPVAGSPIEHPAVREILAQHRCSMFEVGSDGAVDAASLSAVLVEPHAVATLMWANNETGVIQPVEALIDAALATNTPVHIDAVQAVGHVPVNFSALGATTLAASAHKFGGPRGCGILLARRSPAPQPVLRGGGQQRGLRPGTIDVASAYATAIALREACAEMERERMRLAELRDELESALRAKIDGLIVHGENAVRLPGHLHISVPGAEGDSLIMLADAVGLECSTGSACSAGVNRPSEVLRAMGVSTADARAAVRFSLGRGTTRADISRVVAEFPEIARRARSAGMA